MSIDVQQTVITLTIKLFQYQFEIYMYSHFYVHVLVRNWYFCSSLTNVLKSVMLHLSDI